MSFLSLEKNVQSQEDNQESTTVCQMQSSGCLEATNFDKIMKPRKVIAKMKANNRKGYKRKQIEIVPINSFQIYNQNKYLLYGFIEIETYYKDYASPYEIGLVDLSRSHTAVQSIERSKNSTDIIVNYYAKACSGIRDFQFLVDHFSKIPDQRYQELYQYLKQYQMLVNSCIQHIEDISIKLKQRLLSYEEVSEAQEKFKSDFEEYIKSYVTEEDFYLVSHSTLNLEFFEIEIKYSRMSLALLSLLGIEPRNFEMTMLRNQSPFLEQFGLKRMQSAIQQLQVTVSNQYEYIYNDQYYTVDHIPFYCQTIITMYDWKERPSWMSKEECSGAVVKFNLSLEQIKAILEIRSQMNSKKQLEYEMIDDDYHFEYTVESEIFIEKFYPEVFHDKLNKKSLQLKKELMENKDIMNFISSEVKSENENTMTSEENQI